MPENEKKTLFLQEIKPKGIKKSINILLNFVAVILLIAATTPIVLQNRKIQNYFSDIIENEISQKIHSKATIGEVNYQLFNTIRINFTSTSPA